VAEPCGVCESCTEIRAGNAVDVIEIDAATNRGIDEIRELREAARYRPARDRFKIYILDEAHQITDAAFNALLKTLEEPPDHIVFMLATTQPEDIPQTIRSRCQHFSFRAVKFDDIIGQLRDLVGRENIEADDDALALLAEAGDGSMRDALSILDQAIASSSGKLTADSVRNLIGAAPAHILEDVMQAVSRSASEEVLRHVDHLISEGHSPAHFARQMVRFLRNATVAKIAGKDSSLLQVSTEERERVERVAALFGEEDLTRHLQIMLRTHGELGYKQEQRFHLELGLLKMSHAQRLLPIEQLLSEVSASSSSAASSGTPRSGAVSGAPLRTPARPSIVAPATGSAADYRRPEPIAQPRPNPVSPFAADSARKGTPRQESPSDSLSSGATRVSAGGSASPRVVMGATALAEINDSEPEPEAARSEIVSEPAMTAATELAATELKMQTPAMQSPPQSAPSIERLQDGVLQALRDANQRILVSTLEAGEWSVEGSEVVIKISESQTIVDMSVGPDARRIAVAAASGILGRPAKLKIVPGATVAAPEMRNGPPKSNGASPVPGGRNRAESDAVVRRLQEKFGAQIRTVIDYKEKR
jgi:DNA polymerase-3 subunit gamma/tau